MPVALVTGINGFTGRYLTRALKRAGFDVAGIVHSADSRPPPYSFACDLADASRVAEVVAKVRPDVVAHLAGVSYVGHSDVDEVYRTNIVGAHNVLHALATTDHVQPTSVLLASSANIYGNAGQELINESTPPHPMNDYAVSKLAMEYMSRLWADELPLVVVRPFNYTGVGQASNFLLPKIVEHFQQKKEAIELGNIDIARDFSDVRDVVEAYVRLLMAAPAGETFNVCSGNATSLKAVLAMMERIAGYPIVVETNAALVRKNEVRRLRGSNAKLVSEIGTYAKHTLEQTLRWMFQGPSRREGRAT